MLIKLLGKLYSLFKLKLTVISLFNRFSNSKLIKLNFKKKIKINNKNKKIIKKKLKVFIKSNFSLEINEIT